MNTAVTEAFNQGDVKPCADSYAEDAALLLVGRPPIKGREAIVSFLADYAVRGARLAPAEILEVRSDGKIGFCLGRYAFMVPMKGSAPKRGSGKFPTVFMPRADGSWKAVADSLIDD